MKKWHLAAISAALALALSGEGLACEGQAGSIIFEDNFADDSGGWELTDKGTAIAPPAMIMTLSDQFTSIAAQNLTFNAGDGDYCVDFMLPVSPAADNPVAVGVQFWATDYANTMVALVFSSGSIALYKKAGGKWAKIWLVENSTAVKPGTPNSLRAIAKGGKIDILVNGVDIKTVRAQMPTGNLRFGVYAQSDKVPAPAVDVSITGYKVTAGQ